MKHGEGHEVFITTKIAKWLEKNIKHKERIIGGQAGNMANFLGKLGVSCLVYTPFLSKKQCLLFKRNVWLLTKDGLKNPATFSRNDPEKNNWIFEFREGDYLFGIKANGNNRFIASYTPANYVFNPLFDVNILKNTDCVILAGFHNIIHKKNIQLKRIIKLIKTIKKFGKPIHFEIVTMERSLRSHIIKNILSPYVDSIGLDREELREILSVIKQEKLKKQLEKNESIENLYKALEIILKKLNFSRIHLHSKSCFITLCKSSNTDLEKVRNAMEFASVAACAETLGGIKTKQDIFKGLLIPQTSTGRKRVKELVMFLKKRNINLKDGIAKFDDKAIIIVPNRIVKNPKKTVGLGDIISASIWVLENTKDQKMTSSII